MSEKMNENVTEVLTGEVVDTEKIEAEVVQETEADNKFDLVYYEETKPVIKTNYEKLSAALTEKMEEYKNLEVTEDNLKERKKSQKELASLRTKLDEARKEKKKELSKPIVEFEKQCNDLINLVKEVEIPLKNGIAVYDEKKKEENKKYAKEYFDKLANEKGILEKFRSYTVPDECSKLNPTKKEIRTAVETQITLCENAQAAEQQKEDAIKAAIQSWNEKNTTKMQFESFHFIIDSGASLADILDDIARRGQEIYDAEHKVPDPVPSMVSPMMSPMENNNIICNTEDNATIISSPVESCNMSAPAETPIGCINTYIDMPQQTNSMFMAIPEEPSGMIDSDTPLTLKQKPVPVNPEAVPYFEVTFKVTGDYDTLHALSNYINSHNIKKEIISQNQISAIA